MYLIETLGSVHVKIDVWTRPKRKPKESKEDNSFLEHALWVEEAFTESFVNIGKY